MSVKLTRPWCCMVPCLVGGRVPKFTRSYSRVRVLYPWCSKTYPRPAFFNLCCHVIRSAGATRMYLGKIWNTASV
uniref:Uncharacterized protein n=1 Tax=Ixodes ricinus TaxID=34613 RepID=A0A6B0U3I7_IXORI